MIEPEWVGVIALLDCWRTVLCCVSPRVLVIGQAVFEQALVEPLVGWLMPQTMRWRISVCRPSICRWPVKKCGEPCSEVRPRK